jgi:uncharacterized protein
MILNLGDIVEETEVNEVLERDWWHPAENDPILGIGTPLHVSIKVTRVGDKFLLHGKMMGGVVVRCDRCLDSFHWDLESGFHVFLASSGQGKDRAEAELLDEDMEVNFIHGETIDLGEIIREQIYLSLPVRLICKEGCLGLCAVCGANLNAEPCDCSQQNMNPAFQKLKNLKLKGV